MTHANGDVYFGDFKSGKAHGKGVFSDRKGNYFEGDWVNDLQHGTGTESWDYKEIIYEGDFVEGIKTGYGTFQFKGSNYEG
mmetsp:Transcript_6181/g.9996  ORF Transcript_6181/g.9996 Transcript_6181/m.9996 type:complete len:81 (+) Transcript_6181:498-740(+)